MGQILIIDADTNKFAENEEDLTPKKHDFVTQNELHEKIRNDDDYDDWEYGAEPLYESKNYNK